MFLGWFFIQNNIHFRFYVFVVIQTIQFAKNVFVFAFLIQLKMKIWCLKSVSNSQATITNIFPISIKFIQNNA